MQNIHHILSSELNLKLKQVEAVLMLLQEGATVPFIARYRKEATGSLDELQIATLRDRYQALIDLQKRKEAVLKSIAEQGRLHAELEKQVLDCPTIKELEDLYLPYKPKRKTRASVARERGLEPLALRILAQDHALQVEQEARKYLSAEQALADTTAVLAGARDILAELINEDASLRQKMRSYFEQQAQIQSQVQKGKEQEAQKYSDYFDWQEQAAKAPSHRVLAMFRGEDEGLLKLEILPPEEAALQLMEKQFVKARNAAGKQVQMAVQDAYKRLLRPAMETELRSSLKLKADEAAIKVFAANARQLLMAAPLGQKNVLAIDPGFRTGCKLVCLDRQGKLLENATIFPHQGVTQAQAAAKQLMQLCQKYQIEAIAIGNGTAGRETETFVRGLDLPSVLVVMVNESGASIYSASALAREEFPDKDITVRGAVSIGRRLMDPLAELVKIDPKSIGVGQYQHDVDQKKLQQSLDDTVMSCVNSVGVELNTASKELLAYVSGLGPALAQNIVDYRAAHGPFKNRQALYKVPRLGDKAFEQAAGFLRIRQSQHPLDASAVHPERYALVEQMAKDLSLSVAQLLADKQAQQGIVLERYLSATVGLPTLQDIVKELAKPGRDPREQFEAFSFAEGVNTINDLTEGMSLKGIVTNITNFGAFVDIGVHQDGLVHCSEMAHHFVANPADLVKVGQVVQVRVCQVDVSRKRIALSMKAEQVSAKTKQTKATKQNQTKFSTTQKGQTTSAEGDLQVKLAQLKGMFKK